MTKASRAFYFQRQYKRQLVELSVGSICNDQGFFETALQVSEGGLLIRTQFRYKVGDQPELGFFLPNGELVSGLGQVVYVMSTNVKDAVLAGVSFTQIDEQMRRAIRNFVGFHQEEFGHRAKALAREAGGWQRR